MTVPVQMMIVWFVYITQIYPYLCILLLLLTLTIHHRATQVCTVLYVHNYNIPFETTAHSSVICPPSIAGNTTPLIIGISVSCGLLVVITVLSIVLCGIFITKKRRAVYKAAEKAVQSHQYATVGGPEYDEIEMKQNNMADYEPVDEESSKGQSTNCDYQELLQDGVNKAIYTVPTNQKEGKDGAYQNIQDIVYIPLQGTNTESHLYTSLNEPVK